MREWRQISGGADGALTRNARHETSVVNRDQRVDDDITHTRITARKARGFESKHEANDSGSQGFAHTHRVRANKIKLQRIQVRRADSLISELAESGIDTVDRRVASCRIGDDLMTSTNSVARGRMERDLDTTVVQHQ